MRKLGRSIKERTSNIDFEQKRVFESSYKPASERVISSKRNVGIFTTEKTKLKRQLISDEEYRQLFKDLKLQKI